ncbi:hypothetical protein [Aquimarina aquimarini]|uniref:hypothetical protein n=1 Tax=Aquimarina aquimarini TaxID=1191734 RepID=UPI00131F1D27|nr:hypothetical protein [Aquimarina aquimarini]
MIYSLKNLKKINTIICLFMFSFISNAQDKKIDTQVKETLVSIFELSDKGTYADLAPYVIYRGTDATRKWKDTYNSENTEEAEQLQYMYNKIRSLQKYGSYEFVEFITDKESEGQWYVWKLNFNSSNAQKTIYFAFLKINDTYALGDIDIN